MHKVALFGDVSFLSHVKPLLARHEGVLQDMLTKATSRFSGPPAAWPIEIQMEVGRPISMVGFNWKLPIFFIGKMDDLGLALFQESFT